MNDDLGTDSKGNIISFAEFEKNPSVIRKVRNLSPYGATVVRVMRVVDPLCDASDATLEAIAEKRKNIDFTKFNFN